MKPISFLLRFRFIVISLLCVMGMFLFAWQTSFYVAPPVIADESMPCTQTYVVKPGDTLSEIARIYDIPLAQLLSLNPMPNPNLIYVGQRLCLQVGEEEPSTSSPIPAAPFIADSGVALVYTYENQTDILTYRVTKPVEDMENIDDFLESIEEFQNLELTLALVGNSTGQTYQLFYGSDTLPENYTYQQWYEYTWQIEAGPLPATPLSETVKTAGEVSLITGGTLTITQTSPLPGLSQSLEDQLLDLEQDVGNFEWGRLLLRDPETGEYILVLFYGGQVEGSPAPGAWLKAWCQRLLPSQRPWYCAYAR